MKTKTILPIAATIIFTSCATMREGTVVKRWEEKENTFVTVIPAGNIFIPMVVYDDPDFVIEIEGQNRKGKVKTRKFYLTKARYDTTSVGDYFCKGADCYTKDKGNSYENKKRNEKSEQ